MTGRPFNTSTPLGKLMADRGYTVKGLESATDISYRTISDYLAGRVPIRSHHMAILTDTFDVSRDVLLGYEDIESTQQPVVPPVSKSELDDVVAQWLQHREVAS
jgi:hypothetical protein